ncbi:phenylacetaldoxime dehydratase family protein [Streptomyces sp. NPDC052721]|uniref:phenylacetaldoxime dehydratase family protein n=1 Tax=Streptomyces sp. NPDC052721 TaxID=3154955 RepID=UPI003417500A
MESIVFAQYACQSMSAEQAAHGPAALAAWFAGPDGPDVLDRGSFVDTAGAHNVVWLAYWFDPQGHDRWQRSGLVRTAWAQLPAEGPVGH